MTSRFFNKSTRLVLSNRRYKVTQSQDASLAESQSLKSEVISLYKNMIYLSRDWHTDLRPQIHNAFIKNKDVKDPDEIRKLIARGEYICRELTATYQLKKYRFMKRRYYPNE